MTDKMEENDMGRKKQISDQKRLHRERMRLQKGVFSSLATIYTVIHSDSFRRKYSEARNEAVTGAIAYLQGKLGECAAVLVNTATDTEVPAQIRVNAANAALSQCSQWTKNVDVIERLKAMEELMSQVEQEQKSQRRRT